jgi:hypothetical protein
LEISFQPDYPVDVEKECEGVNFFEVYSITGLKDEEIEVG